MGRILSQLLTAGLVLCGANAFATEKLESSIEQVAVIELFTSHGCSSCPPADQWLAGFEQYPGLWREVVPLAFHVDYWDGLGWPDRFASPDFSRRQRDYQRTGGIQTVYTPGFVVKGREWRGWFRGKQPALEPGPKVGRLSVEFTPGKTAKIRFAPLAPLPHDYVVQLAVLGFGLSSPIGGGENAGKLLRDDFVVLGVSKGNSQQGSAPVWDLEWPQTKSVETARRAVVAWVSHPQRPSPVQAVGGWLP